MYNSSFREPGQGNFDHRMVQDLVNFQKVVEYYLESEGAQNAMEMAHLAKFEKGVQEGAL